MSLSAPQTKSVEGASFSIGIAAALFNADLVNALLGRVTARLLTAGVRASRIRVVRVPGSHELPWAARELARGKCDCVIALGVLIGGDTSHHIIVGTSVSHALQRVALDRRVPVINGVIVADTLAQAEARCRGRINRGAEFAGAALTMAGLKRMLRK